MFKTFDFITITIKTLEYDLMIFSVMLCNFKFCMLKAYYVICTQFLGKIRIGEMAVVFT
jgi:hypothetical protein